MTQMKLKWEDAINETEIITTLELMCNEHL